MKKLKALICTATAFMLCAGLFAGCGGQQDPPEDDAPPACEHALEKIEGKDATCFEEGNFTYYKCGKCGELFSDKNGKNPTTLQDVTIETTTHDMHYYDEPVNSHDEYYFCNTCGRYYTDSEGKTEIPYEEMQDSSVTPIQLANNWSDSAGVSAQSRDFTIRCFVGWTEKSGKDISQFPTDGRSVMINFNLNRKCTLNNTGWYGFGVQYSAANGLRYRDFETDTRTEVAAEFTNLFIEKGGIWVRIVRKGADCSFYFEDKFGIPIFISSNSNFDASEALIRFAIGEAEKVVDWSPAPLKAEICWNIANPRCVFNNK